MEYFLGNYSDFSPMGNVNVADNANGVNFTVDDLLDLSKEDETMTDAFFESLTGNSDGSSTVTAVDSCNSSISGSEAQFNGNLSCRSFNDTRFSDNELCVPYDDLAELEWLSNFVEESFSNDDIQFIPTTNASSADSSSSAITSNSPSPQFFPADVSVPGKARSKRSRAAPCDWSSRLLLISPFSSSKMAPSKKREPTETPGRKCLHCGSDKTPQWRSGPMGPKTLCNACGVRFKSGRLVPEYRPASSPSFVSTKHSNSHRKVLELRKQKELQIHQRQQVLGQASIFHGCDEFLIPHHGSVNGQDFSHMIQMI